MRPLGFYFLLKFQPLFCFAGLRVGSRLHPQFFPGRQTRLGVLQLLFHTLGPAPCLGQLFIRRLRWQLVSGKFQLGRPFRFSFGCPRLFLLGFLGFCRLLETLLVFVAVLVRPASARCFPGICTASLRIAKARQLLAAAPGKICIPALKPAGITVPGILLPAFAEAVTPGKIRPALLRIAAAVLNEAVRTPGRLPGSSRIHTGIRCRNRAVLRSPLIQVPPFIAVIFLHRRVTGPAQIKIRAAHLAGPDVAFRFSCRLPGRVFCPSEFFITGYIHHLQSELSLLVCRRSCACHFIRPCGKDRIQKGVLREVIDKWNNHVAEKQKALAGAGMGHIGKLVGRNA